MATPLDIVLPEIVDTIIEELGTTLVLVRQNSEYDPVELTRSEQEDSYELRCAPPEAYQFEMPTGAIRTQVKWLVPKSQFAKYDINPDQCHDKIVFDDVARTVLRIEPIFSGVERIAYYIHAVL